MCLVVRTEKPSQQGEIKENAMKSVTNTVTNSNTEHPTQCNINVLIKQYMSRTRNKFVPNEDSLIKWMKLHKWNTSILCKKTKRQLCTRSHCFLPLKWLWLYGSMHPVPCNGSQHPYGKTYVQCNIPPLLVFITDTDDILCVVQAETEETVDHQNVTIECD